MSTWQWDQGVSEWVRRGRVRKEESGKTPSGLAGPDRQRWLFFLPFLFFIFCFDFLKWFSKLNSNPKQFKLSAKNCMVILVSKSVSNTYQHSKTFLGLKNKIKPFPIYNI